MSTLGKRLREVREVLNLKQGDLAKEVESNQKSISSYENDKAMISGAVISHLVNKFDVNSNWLFTGQGNMFLNDSQTTVKKIITGNNNQAVVNLSNGENSTIVGISNSSNEISEEKSIIKDIVNKLNNVHDNKLLNYIDDEITALISRVQMRKEYGSSFGG